MNIYNCGVSSWLLHMYFIGHCTHTMYLFLLRWLFALFSSDELVSLCTSGPLNMEKLIDDFDASWDVSLWNN